MSDPRAEARAIADIRDCVLNGRNQLEGMEVDNDIINAVLGIIDDHTPAAPPALVEAETWRKAARYARDCAHERACQLDGFQGSAEAAGWIRCKQSEAERIAEWLEKQANQPSDTLSAPPSLVWTSEKPKGEGWYWWRVTGQSDESIVRILSNAQTPNDPIIQFQNGHCSHMHNLSAFSSQWCGPLPRPGEGNR